MNLNLYKEDFDTLSEHELTELNGGIAFVPLLVAGGKILGAGVLSGAGWYVGEKIANTIFN